MKPTLWFDKDGVLAKYDYRLYEKDGDIPAPWTLRNVHVFRHMEVRSEMAEAFMRIYKENTDLSERDRLCNVRVLTSVCDSYALSEHVLDVAYWCNTNLHMDSRDLYVTATSKESVPIQIYGKITKQDILLDDYVPNLDIWRKAGGTSIKVLNGINSETSEFPFIPASLSAGKIYKILMYIIDTVKADKEVPNGILYINL